jgi:hypothetical protein
MLVFFKHSLYWQVERSGVLVFTLGTLLFVTIKLFNLGNGSADIFGAIRYAAKLLFRPGVSKTFILLPCTNCDPANSSVSWKQEFFNYGTWNCRCSVGYLMIVYHLQSLFSIRYHKRRIMFDEMKELRSKWSWPVSMHFPIIFLEGPRTAIKINCSGWLMFSQDMNLTSPE